MASYTLPPWLNPQNSVQEYARGISIGANIAQERNRLQAQMQQQAIATEMRKQEMERQAIKDQQELLVQKAYQDAQIGLQQQKLKEAEAVTAMKTKAAADRFTAQQVYTRRVQGGEEPAKVLMEMGPALGQTMTGAASLYKAMQPRAQMGEPTVQELGGQKFARIPQPSGGYRLQQIKTPDKAMEGPIQAQNVYYPGTTNAIPGLVAVPTGTGGMTTRNVPDATQRRAASRVREIEKGAFGLALQMEAPPKDKKQLEAYLKIKKEYEAAKAILAGTEPEKLGRGDVKPPAAGTAPAGSRTQGRVHVKDPSGETGWLREDQLDEALAAGWEQIP